MCYESTEKSLESRAAIWIYNLALKSPLFRKSSPVDLLCSHSRRSSLPPKGHIVTDSGMYIVSHTRCLPVLFLQFFFDTSNSKELLCRGPSPQGAHGSHRMDTSLQFVHGLKSLLLSQKLVPRWPWLSVTVRAGRRNGMDSATISTVPSAKVELE